MPWAAVARSPIIEMSTSEMRYSHWKSSRSLPNSTLRRSSPRSSNSPDSYWSDAWNPRFSTSRSASAIFIRARSVATIICSASVVSTTALDWVWTRSTMLTVRIASATITSSSEKPRRARL